MKGCTAWAALAVASVLGAVTATSLSSEHVASSALPPALCVTQEDSTASAIAHVASGRVHGIFESVMVAQCDNGETAPLSVLEFVPVGPKNISTSWQMTVEAIVDVVFTSKGRVVARNLTPAQRDAVPIQTEIIPVLSTPMKPVARTEANTLRLQAMSDRLKTNGADPIVERLIGDITASRIEETLNYLTGVTSEIRSRNSIHPDGQKAAEWVAAQFEKYGFTVEFDHFREGYFPNVIAKRVGSIQPDVEIVVGGHLDSRGPDRESATAPAPGANDDGSGVQTLLQLARVISEYDADFKYTLVLGAWGGEEQGLVGSRAYAKKCKDNGVNIAAMIQADMIAYRAGANEEGLQCGFPDRYADPILTDLAQLVMNTYVPDVETCYTQACCSDHQSFYEQGYSATQFFERCGSIIDPMYHAAGDIIKRPGYDLNGQLLLITKGYAATALTLAEFNG